MHIQSLQAVLTAHGAAPVEFTLTLGHPGDAGGVISSAAAHDFTAVHASGSQVAHTACCTQGAWKTSQGGVIERVWVDYNKSQEEKQEVHPLGQGPRPTSTQPGAVTLLYGSMQCMSFPCAAAGSLQRPGGQNPGRTDMKVWVFLWQPEFSSPLLS